ncbi:MAG: adenylate/guanylate cyclase domain-containing protein [Saprospiraceae bacterium]|nr:adenylate/guanylate cyclase domain-containing protein [Saprospiraceae bacterium]
MERLLKKEYRDQWILHSSRRLTGRDALEKLLEQTGSPGFSVEKNKVVVMFADMRGFTRISEGLQPEELITLLNAYLTSMIRAVNGQDGYVVQIQGDAILAVFSLPETRPDDPERSMLSGLTMLEQNERLNNRNLDVHPVINIGIGMHYGEVVTGLIGSPLKRSYTMIGDVVNTASRIEGLTKVLGFPILVTLDLKLALHEPGQYLFMPLGKYILYGKKEAISIFALLGAAGEDPQALHQTRWVRNAEEAFVFFENRDFDAAIKKFSELAHMTKISGFDYLVKQSYHFQKEPPGPEWEGSITLDNK